MTDNDPVTTNPDFYRLVFENEHVRVLEYTDQPGEKTTPHAHPNSVMVTLSDFERRLTLGERSLDVALESGKAVWLPAQHHYGENIGTSPTHSILVELKGEAAGTVGDTVLGPN